jgi:hypothetical protein
MCSSSWNRFALYRKNLGTYHHLLVAHSPLEHKLTRSLEILGHLYVCWRFSDRNMTLLIKDYFESGTTFRLPPFFWAESSSGTNNYKFFSRDSLLSRYDQKTTRPTCLSGASWRLLSPCYIVDKFPTCISCSCYSYEDTRCRKVTMVSHKSLVYRCWVGWLAEASKGQLVGLSL